MNPLLLSGLFDIGSKLIDHFFPNEKEKAEAKFKLLEMQQKGELALLAADTDLAKLQIQTNVEEAKHPSLFVAGWRPHIGWVCGFAFSYHYLLLPFLQFLVFTFGTAEMVKQVAMLPAIDLGTMMPVLVGMLGLGAMRTYEKAKDVEGNR
jgi:hypothetical protein